MRRYGLTSLFGGGGERRRALEAEAAGDYAEAARAFAELGERAKVAEMHLLDSERARDPDGKLAALREGARWCDEQDEDSRRVRRRIANAMLAWVRARGVVTAGDRAVLDQAAALFRSAGDGAGAGACLELLGSVAAAAEAYQAAGEVDRLERVLETEADRRRRAVALSDAVEEHRLRLRAGDPGGALAALASGIEAADARDRPGLQRMQAELLARRLPTRRAELRAAGERIFVVDAPITVGRELGSGLPLRDGGVSRQHAELVREGAGWVLVDLGSKNGTTLGGVPVQGRIPLPPVGELGFGDRCAVAFRVDEDGLTIEITRGLDRGARLRSPLTASPLDRGRALGGRFVDGHLRLRALSGVLRLNGVSVTGEIEPLVADVLDLGEQRWEVG